MIRIHYGDKKLKQMLHVLEADITAIKKNIDLMPLAQRMRFLLNMFQMIAIALDSVINHYVNGMHLFRDALMTETRN